jgi:hypothetical protein
MTRIFSCSGGNDTDSKKIMSRYVKSNMCFCIQRDLWVTSCIPVRAGRETSTYYFSCSGATDSASNKSAL